LPRKIPPDIVRTNVQSGYTARLALRFDYHTHRRSTLDKVSREKMKSALR
jgi:hypothetical protein